jgi:hypothetical protein
VRDYFEHALFASRTARRKSFAAGTVATLALLCAYSISSVQAQSKLGVYSGSINVSEALNRPNLRLTSRATVKVNLPLTERNSSSLSAEFLSGEAPAASVQITQWDTFHKESSADSGGQFNTSACSLAAPVEIPMTPTGVLNVDLRAKKHSLSIVLLSTQDVAFNCTHSRSGAFKKKMGLALLIGTGTPGMESMNPLPFTDPARLSAKYTLMPTSDAKGEHGPIVQEWDFRLEK